jgi:hypothetical protein
VVNLICAGLYFGPAVHRDAQIEHLLNIGDFVLKSIMAEANYQKEQDDAKRREPLKTKGELFLDYDMSRFALSAHMS